jgi:hypothetical protein
VAHAFLSVLVLAAAAQSSTPTETTAPAKLAIRAAIGAILQADGTRANDLLSKIPASDLDAKDTAFRSCAVARLSGTQTDATAPATGRSAFAQQIMAAYQSYWRQAINNPAAAAQAEKALLARLSALLGQPLADEEAAEPLLTARLAQDGLYGILGKTGKLSDLMIWSKQRVRSEAVALPEGANKTPVTYLDGFLTQGWSNYFSCDRTGTGGWTKPEGLYVIVPSYDSLSDENFRVNFLAHESQHYSDKHRFPGLSNWRQEYRAKLVELVYAQETHTDVLQRFLDSQGDDGADAHSFANKKLVIALKAALAVATDDELLAAPVAAVQKAALAELLADSKRIRAERQSGKAEEQR